MSKLIRKINTLIHHPYTSIHNYVAEFVSFCCGKIIPTKLFRRLPDRLAIRIRFYHSCRRICHLRNPKTFNEKLQWLKLNDRRYIYTSMVDKYEAKKFVAAKGVDEKYIIPTLGVYNSFQEIDFDNLPESFVLKCTHDSGSVVVCKDKKEFDMEKAKMKLERGLCRNYYYGSREWPYKNVKPRIIAEKYMRDRDNENLPVYKIFCFMGNPTIIQTILNDKTLKETVDYYDTEWHKLNIRQGFPNSDELLEKPEKLALMLNIARKLSAGFPFLRIDLYYVNGDVYFSEYTFYSDSGLTPFVPDEWDRKLGDLIILPY